MRQFVLPESWNGGRLCELSGRDAKRLTAVLRLGIGDVFPAIDGAGLTYGCTIAVIDGDRVALNVEPLAGAGSPDGYLPDVRTGRARGPATQGVAPAATASPCKPQAAPEGPRDPAIDTGRAAVPRLVLAVGLLKGSKLDDVARAAAEAGVSTIIPLVTARSALKEHSGARIARLRRVVAEAIGQSGSATPTRIAEPETIAGLCATFPPIAGERLGVFFHEMPLAQTSIHRYCTRVPDEIVACVGPEGGFCDDEIVALSACGYLPAWLGPTVLRAETAAIFAVASLRIVCLERFSWSTIESKE